MKPTLHDCWRLWALAWVELAQALVVLLSFGAINPSWRAMLVFSDWFDPEP